MVVRRILDEGGNAADAAISVLLCMGVTIPESLGLGGGSMMVIYNATTKKSTFINARETAPAAAYRDMFNNTQTHNNRSSYGIESIAVPGDVAGYWRAFSKFGSGKITWRRLFEDAIKFARDGFPVGQHLNDALEQNRKSIMWLKPMHQVYVNPATKDLYKVDEIFKQPVLAETLTQLANATNPKDFFYNTLSKKILEDIYKVNAPQFPGQKGIITRDDFLKYDVLEEEAFTYEFDNKLKVHTAQLPGAGVLLSFILRVMNKYPDLYPTAKFDQGKADLFYHRLTEAFKFAFANRMYLGDDKFDKVQGVVKNLTSDAFINHIIKEINDEKTFPSSSGYYDAKKMYNGMDKGTAHVAVLDGQGNAVTVTSTVNLYFGSKVLSPSTGIILNDEMDDFNIGTKNEFDLPASFANIIQPGKRPLSSMSPAIFTDDTGIRLVIGASGGPKILTSVAYTALRQLWFGDNIKQAIDSCRVHDQLFPEKVTYEPCFPETILRSMKQRKHNTTELPVGVRGAVVMGIARSRNNSIEANSDYRKGGTVA
ncbi:PREDICTED: gamma-glutamyltranspeptidase 1-like, partial [Rhagoletis zephyria]|uniref:gamma-glutamyltranspeptidase 1-like n=1 Tax=Rhagoletis zephyria TaxID=28612 RepID=UPI0008112ED2